MTWRRDRLAPSETSALTRTLLEATAPDLRSPRRSEPLPRVKPEMANRRYILLERIGEGGMGEVYRALDRLHGRGVALKRVGYSHDPRGSRSRRLALAAEFHHLTTLRHPNVVRIFDYGFDEKGTPFFTMELIEGGQSLLEAGRDATEKARVELLVELLRALGYLHRQGVIHRDVKPSNVIVDGRRAGTKGGRRVKLLDFGIATPRRGDSEARLSGSLPYLAPETLAGEPPSPATDLYGVGVVGFELFAGRHPFEGEPLPTLFDRIARAPIDLSALDAGEAVRRVIGRLLAKNPSDRYRSAEEAIGALGEAVGRSHRKESAEARESFLTSARLRGRDAELQRLEKDLDDAAQGHGGLRLLAGAAGMGKSRLLNEIRSQALVRGLPILEGRAVRGLKSRFAPWRDILRALVLLCEVEPSEAAVLEEPAQGVGVLLGREVEPAPGIGPRAELERLSWTVETLFSRLGKAVVVLEDLHWASSESLVLLARLARYAASGQLLIFATFDHGVAGDLPERIRPKRRRRVGLLQLQPLGRDAIAELAEAILGEAPAPGMVRFLERAGEGNPGATIEVIRDLAASAGGLEMVGRTRLPDTVYESLWVPSSPRIAA